MPTDAVTRGGRARAEAVPAAPAAPVDGSTARRRRVAGVVAVGLLLALTGCAAWGPSPEHGTTIDLLQQDWGHVPGIDPGDEGLRVTATGRTIVEQDGEGGQSDPPVNLAGVHLEAAEEFSLHASFARVEADATFAVYDQPPIIADEFRIEPAGLEVTVRGDDVRVAVRDGSQPEDVTAQRPDRQEHVTVDDPDVDVDVTVRRSGDRVDVTVDGQQAAFLPSGDVFASGELWLGLSSEHGSFTVRSLTAAAPAGATLATAGPALTRAEASPDGLQARAARIRPDFRIGAAVALGPAAADTDYARRLVGEFGAITPENAMKAQAIAPRQGEYRFEEADALLDLAASKGLAVHGHTIAFTEAMPRWMRDLPTGSERERAASGAVLLDHVDRVVTHFRGRLDSLDVINEPFDVDQGTRLQENVWYRVFGPDYPAVVSKAVHEADPDVRQFINENGADIPGPRQEALLRLASETNEQGGAIDGVGLQTHVYDLGTDAVSADDLAATLRTFHDAGLLVRISENDVTDGEGTDAQADQYATVLGACLSSEACVSYTTWGIDDRYDWWTDDEGILRQGHDLLFDDGAPTPAYDALREVLAR